MADKTGIEWTSTHHPDGTVTPGATWNPVRGCSRVSTACENCYAEGVANRFKGAGLPYEGLIAKGGQWNGKITLVPEILDQPLRWQRPRKIFVNSMSDLFHDNVPTDFIDKVFAVMSLAHWHTFQILTKRPQRMYEYLSDPCVYDRIRLASHIPVKASVLEKYKAPAWPLPNVWLGVSVENQETYDERVSFLEQTPAAVRMLSMEPLLGPVNLNLAQCQNGHGWVTPILVNSDKDMGCPTCKTYVTSCGPSNRPGHFLKRRGIDWVIVGGESGKGARPMHPAWALSLHDQCKAAGIPFFFKQWGEWEQTSPVAGGDLGADMRRGLVEIVKLVGESNGHLERGDVLMRKVGKKNSGRLLNGVLHDNFPKVAA